METLALLPEKKKTTTKRKVEEKETKLSNYMEENSHYRAVLVEYIQEKRAREKKKAALEMPLLQAQLNIAMMKQNRMIAEGLDAGLSLYKVDYPREEDERED